MKRWHRLRFAFRKLFGAKRPSDIRLAIYGPPALTALAKRTGETHYALPKKSFYSVHSELKLFFDPWDISGLVNDPDVIGFHISSTKDRANELPVPGSLYAWAAERFA
jgi:hypothetical protein